MTNDECRMDEIGNVAAALAAIREERPVRRNGAKTRTEEDRAPLEMASVRPRAGVDVGWNDGGLVVFWRRCREEIEPSYQPWSP